MFLNCKNGHRTMKMAVLWKQCWLACGTCLYVGSCLAQYLELLVYQPMNILNLVKEKPESSECVRYISVSCPNVK